MYINSILCQFLFILIADQLSIAIVNSLPTYNPSTRCHDLTLADENLTFAICLQRLSNKQHPFNLFTSPNFCSVNYPPFGHLISFNSLSSSIIHRFFQSLIELLNSKDSKIDYPIPNFLWINSNYTQNQTNQSFWCSEQCQTKNSSGKFLILKLNCQSNQPCITTKQTHWDRAPFICVTNQTLKQDQPTSVHISPTYTNNTIVFYDSTPCVIVRSSTHQYTFCFRHQLCPYSQTTSAFCTAKSDAYDICQRDKDGSSLLTIENDDEYQLVNDVITLYSNQTLLNFEGLVKSRLTQRAQWMWIDGSRDLNNLYRWNITSNQLSAISEKYWCDNISQCLGGKGRDHIVLNIVCHTNKSTAQVCLASRRYSEPGPFICKRTLRDNEELVTNYTFLKTSMEPIITSVYEKNLTSIYYDEHHCLTVQTRIHLYTFCLRRQECMPRQAFCTKWSRAQKECQLLKNHSQLLTIDNEQERILITDIIENYYHETRLTFNGSSYRYFQLADFIWIDGVQQADNQTYRWKNELEIIPNYLWCSKNECTSFNRTRVMLNLQCNQNQSLVCLSTRLEWQPAPYICKRIRPIDPCPILFEKIRLIQWSEMLVITVNRTIILIKCKHPEYINEIKEQYQCDIQSKQWNLTYENKNFICPGYQIPPMASKVNTSQPWMNTNISTTLRPSYFTRNISSEITDDDDCSQSYLSTLISRLPTDSRYIYTRQLISYSSSYYDIKLLCHYNNLIQITYRCDRPTRQWIYVYGHTNNFRRCSPLCNENEQNDLFNKYFTRYEQQQIRTDYIERKNFLRLRCFNRNQNRWRSVNYKCGTMTITQSQWYRLHSCFQSTLTTTLPTVIVSLIVNDATPSCPPPVISGDPCEYQTGEYIYDSNGCRRKICPSLSQLCHTIRCPSDRICRVIPCRSCIYTNYLQAVCEYQKEPSLCEYERQVLLLNDYESINRWERQTMAIVRRYANEQRQRLRSPWPVLTIN